MRVNKSIIFSFNIASIYLVTFAVMATIVHTANAAQLVVFSGRKEPLIKPIIQLFEKEMGTALQA